MALAKKSYKLPTQENWLKCMMELMHKQKLFEGASGDTADT